jgi:hypothetical protein
MLRRLLLDAAQTLLKRCQQRVSIGHLPLQLLDTAAQERAATSDRGFEDQRADTGARSAGASRQCEIGLITGCL